MGDLAKNLLYRVSNEQNEFMMVSNGYKIQYFIKEF